jgi:hypothetical protein
VLLPDVSDRCIDQFGVAYVDGMYICTLTVLGVDLGGCLLQHLHPPAPQMHLRAVRSQSVCDPFAQTSAPTGNQNAFRNERRLII